MLKFFLLNSRISVGGNSNVALTITIKITFMLNVLCLKIVCILKPLAFTYVIFIPHGLSLKTLLITPLGNII